jgi:hypothetical protein
MFYSFYLFANLCEGNFMSTETATHDDDMPANFDFSQGVRFKYLQRSKPLNGKRYPSLQA